MSNQATRYLQQEIARLQKETQAQQFQIAELHRYIEVLTEFYWLGQTLTTHAEPLRALDEALYRVLVLTGARDGSVLQFDRAANELVFVVVHGRLRHTLPGHRLPVNIGVAGWVMETGEKVIVNNPHQDWRFSTSVDQEFAFLTRSILCVPVRWEGQVVGLVELVNKDSGGFTNVDAALLTVLSDIAARALTLAGPSALLAQPALTPQGDVPFAAELGF